VKLIVRIYRGVSNISPICDNSVTTQNMAFFELLVQ